MIQKFYIYVFNQRKWKHLPRTDTCNTNVHCSVTYNSQDKETCYGWMNKENVYTQTHTHTQTSHKKKKEILPFVTWMSLEGIMFSEVKSETDKYWTVWFHFYVESKKKNTKTLPLKLSYREDTGCCQRWGVGEVGEVGQRYKFPVTKSSSGDVIYSLVTIVHNTVLYIWKLQE